MSSGEVRKVSRQDIQLVQNLIEFCLQLYMNRKEVIDTVSSQAKIEPNFTELVWQKLEEENREFFKAYHVRLMLKNQIMVFNRLLEQQVELMQKSWPARVAPIRPDGLNSSPMHQTPSCYMSEHASTSVSSGPSHMLSSGASSAFANGRLVGKEASHIGNGSPILAGSMDASTSMMPTQVSDIGRIIEMNAPLIKAEPSYSSNSEFLFCNDATLLEAHQPITDTSVGSFSSSEFFGQTLDDSLLDIDASSFGLGQIPRNFNLTYLTDDFTEDILENYGCSPLLPHEANKFQDSPSRDFHEEENRRLDTISEDVSCDDFGSD